MRLRLGGLCLVLTAAACSGGEAPTESAPSLAASQAASTPTVAGSGSAAPSMRATASEAPTATPPAALGSDPLHAIALTDVRSGERVTLGQLAAERPLLLETMAIWCTNCRAQQHNVVAAHALADFHSLSLDVDPGELPQDLAAYAEREGFDWHFAMADAAVVRQLRERFGTAVALPPGMPKILFRTDGSIEMIGLGELYSAEQIAAAVGG
jgi:hypothetical protein